ncbi:hypothetical protein AYJ54_15865 [Bradyrhizobium centrolobii]|uniref:Uncharacterized protein n=1 Tax=Bradyrhizobium centrolobii TaxID=1505087 RepID=A0A176YN70_9BRAD|nr:hypothetical protein AYJ54_15865 [Bradyrhizobium centrolobii]
MHFRHIEPPHPRSQRQAVKVVKYASNTTAKVIARMRSEKVRDMMESVAAGAEGLNASVCEIAEAMSRS